MGREVIEFIKYELWILDNTGGVCFWFSAGKRVSKFSKGDVMGNFAVYTLVRKTVI